MPRALCFQGSISVVLTRRKNAVSYQGGERNRLHLALTLKSGANVLLLDEPTNDIDVNTLRALEEGLESFAGMLCSHFTRPLVFGPDRYTYSCIRRRFTDLLSLKEVTRNTKKTRRNDWVTPPRTGSGTKNWCKNPEC